MKNIKDILTTICGLIFAICMALVPMMENGTIVLSIQFKTAIYLCMGISVGIIGFFNGKKPSGANKSTYIVNKLNRE